MGITCVGFRSFAQASANRHLVPALSQFLRANRAAEKDLIFAEAKKAHPKDFWKRWVTRCPAWRSDRPFASYQRNQCGALAIVRRKEGRSVKEISCLECGYEGEYFRIKNST